MSVWDDRMPIYLQLRHRIVEQILKGVFAEGEAIPSVRQVASDEKINPITISKAYQMLVEENLVEKRRGLGMYVRAGGRALALSQERTHFLKEEWPKIRGRLASLEIDLETLPGLEKTS